MTSRMDKYFDNNNKQETPRYRTNKNSHLYENIYETNKYNSENDISLNNTSEINLSSIKNTPNSREAYQKVKDFKNLVTMEIEKDINNNNQDIKINIPTKEKVYDINTILERARGEREILSNITNTANNYSNANNKTDKDIIETTSRLEPVDITQSISTQPINENPVKNINTPEPINLNKQYNNIDKPSDKDITRENINTPIKQEFKPTNSITQSNKTSNPITLKPRIPRPISNNKKASNNEIGLLDMLKSNENTIVTKPIEKENTSEGHTIGMKTASISKIQTQLKELSDTKISKQNEPDKTFYSDSYKFKKKDFDIESENNSEQKNSMFIYILITIILIIAIITIIFILLTK